MVAGTPWIERPVLVAVDGVDGSGKTTFAERLRTAYEAVGRPAVVVHLDDFHHPRAVRYRQGRDSPRGFFEDTTDLETFRRCVLDPIDRGGPAEIVAKAFDHAADRAVRPEPMMVPAGGVVIVEGMFLHRDDLAHRWDVSVFLDVPFSVSVARLAARDGSHPDPDHPSLRRYVEGQRLYLARCTPAARATVVVDNT